MPIKNRFAETHAEIIGWRRHLHMHPELGFDVHNTAKFVEERLREFGITDITTRKNENTMCFKPTCTHRKKEKS